MKGLEASLIRHPAQPLASRLPDPGFGVTTSNILQSQCPPYVRSASPPLGPARDGHTNRAPSGVDWCSNFTGSCDVGLARTRAGGNSSDHCSAEVSGCKPLIPLASIIHPIDSTFGPNDHARPDGPYSRPSTSSSAWYSPSPTAIQSPSFAYAPLGPKGLRRHLPCPPSGQESAEKEVGGIREIRREDSARSRSTDPMLKTTHRDIEQYHLLPSSSMSLPRCSHRHHPQHDRRRHHHPPCALQPLRPTSGDRSAGMDNPARYKKPQMPMINLLRLVLSAHPQHKMTLPQLYHAIVTRWPYFEHTESAWKNTVRHNLSLHDEFVNEEKPPDEQWAGKGGYWRLVLDEPSRGHHAKAPRTLSPARGRHTTRSSPYHPSNAATQQTRQAPQISQIPRVPQDRQMFMRTSSSRSRSSSGSTYDYTPAAPRHEALKHYAHPSPPPPLILPSIHTLAQAGYVPFSPLGRFDAPSAAQSHLLILAGHARSPAASHSRFQ